MFEDPKNQGPARHAALTLPSQPACLYLEEKALTQREHLLTQPWWETWQAVLGHMTLAPSTDQSPFPNINKYSNNGLFPLRMNCYCSWGNTASYPDQDSLREKEAHRVYESSGTQT